MRDADKLQVADGLRTTARDLWATEGAVLVSHPALSKPIGQLSSADQVLRQEWREAKAAIPTVARGLESVADALEASVKEDEA